MKSATRRGTPKKTPNEMGISEQNQTAERNYGFTSSKPKPKNMAKKSVKVTITKTKHKGKQKYAVRIEQGKTDLLLSQRYTRPHSAERGALRKLDARTSSGAIGREWNYTGGFTWYTPKGQMIQFVNK